MDHELPLLYDLLVTRLRELLAGWGVPPSQLPWMALLVGSVMVSTTLWLLAKVINGVLTAVLHRLAVKTSSALDDNLIHHRVPRYAGRIVPLVMAFNLVPVVLADFPRWVGPVERLVHIFFIILAVRIVRALLGAVRDTLKVEENYKGKPLDSYMQVISIVLWAIAVILIFTQLTGRSAMGFLTAMGAASAVLLLIFKDAILGFVASIQISANDLVRIGDWIEMPKYGADGDVIEINLTTVKVRNWDKTVTTVPTYALIGDSFKNWRAMFEGGGRRIKRAIRVKISSIRHLTDAELDDLRRIQLLAPYIDERRAEIARYNAAHNVDRTMPVNGRNITNVGLYRKYIELYLANHPGIHPDMTRMVRQLPPDAQGLPLELYCFTRDTRWIVFESVMADVFDHLLAINQYFHLEVFESPAADDLRSVGADRSGPAVRIT